MNKLELIQTLKNRTELSNQDARGAVHLFFDSLTEAMLEGERVEIRGFCSFHIKEYKGYTGRNPKIGKQVQVLPKKLPFFKVGKELKDRVDYPKET